MWMTPLASMVGSATPGVPLARMQVAHSSSSWVGLPLGSVVVEKAAVPLLSPRLATCGELPPPHPAKPIAAITAATKPAETRCVLIISRLHVTCS